YGGGNLRDGEYPAAEHPAVRTHPVTGRPALYVNEGFTIGFKELKQAESQALLGFLVRHCGQPEFQCRFRWRRHSVAFWDN
ncbi:MAG TPA: taurine dioxygenase, partial [Acidobacteria bacterium]|nr:taurine dioxygenase [Acidobacteriota bacterium]